MTLLNFIGDWIYAFWISIVPPKDKPGDEAQDPE